MSSAGETSPKKVSIVAFIKRKPGLTPDQFYHHWVNIHGPLVKPWAMKHGFLSYRQIHLLPELNAGRAPVGPEIAGQHTELQAWDGCAVFEILSLEAFEAAFQDTYYKEVISRDEEQFVDKTAGVMRARGELNTII